MTNQSRRRGPHNVDTQSLAEPLATQIDFSIQDGSMFGDDGDEIVCQCRNLEDEDNLVRHSMGEYNKRTSR